MIRDITRRVFLKNTFFSNQVFRVMLIHLPEKHLVFLFKIPMVYSFSLILF